MIQGDHVLIGARLDDTAGANVGQVHLFDTLTGALLQTFDDPTVTLGDEFGRSVALDGNHVVVGAFKDSTLGSEVGQAHLFAYGAPRANFTVSLSSPSSEIVTVDFNTVDGTAKVVDGDYTATSGTLVFEPGVTSRTILVPVTDDANKELDEDFFVNLSGTSWVRQSQTHKELEPSLTMKSVTLHPSWTPVQTRLSVMPTGQAANLSRLLALLATATGRSRHCSGPKEAACSELQPRSIQHSTSACIL